MASTPNSPSSESPSVTLTKTPGYRDGYANSVQIRLSMWDLLLTFGTLQQTGPDTLELENFQGIFMSPQQAKALYGLLGQNLAQYEAAFGPISLESPSADKTSAPAGPRPVQ